MNSCEHGRRYAVICTSVDGAVEAHDVKYTHEHDANENARAQLRFNGKTAAIVYDTHKNKVIGQFP